MGITTRVAAQAGGYPQLFEGVAQVGALFCADFGTLRLVRSLFFGHLQIPPSKHARRSMQNSGTHPH
jgi:hypothetical protein